MAEPNASWNGSPTPSPTPFDHVLQTIREVLPLAVIIVIVNSIVVFLFLKSPQLRTPQNHFLLGLASSDLLTGLLNIPLFIARSVAGDFVSFLVPLTHNFTAILAAYQILAVTADKYLGVRRPFEHRSFGNKTARRILGAIWLGSSLLAFFPFFLYHSRHDKAVWDTLMVGYTIFCIIVVFLVPYAFMVYAQCVMFKTISKSPLYTANENEQLDRRRAEQRSKTDRKCLVVFTSMAIIYAIFWFPWFVIQLLLFTIFKNKKDSLESAAMIFAIVRYLSSIINPLIYTFFKRDFMDAFKRLVLRKSVNTGTNSFNMQPPRPQ